MKIIAKNPNAKRNYELKETFNAGIELFGTEVKSIRQGNVNLKDTYCMVRNNEVWLLNMYIKPYEKGNIQNKDPKRNRKLLLNKREIRKIADEIKIKKLSLVPISIYWDRQLVKVEIGLGKGKKLYDKRKDIAKRDDERNIQRAMKING